MEPTSEPVEEAHQVKSSKLQAKCRVEAERADANAIEMAIAQAKAEASHPPSLEQEAAVAATRDKEAKRAAIRRLVDMKQQAGPEDLQCQMCFGSLDMEVVATNTCQYPKCVNQEQQHVVTITCKHCQVRIACEHCFWEAGEEDHDHG